MPKLWLALSVNLGLFGSAVSKWAFNLGNFVKTRQGLHDEWKECDLWRRAGFIRRSHEIIQDLEVASFERSSWNAETFTEWVYRKCGMLSERVIALNIWASVGLKRVNWSCPVGTAFAGAEDGADMGVSCATPAT